MAMARHSNGKKEDETAAALQKYSAFVEGVLKPQLTETLAKRDELTREMNEYQELLELVRELQSQQQQQSVAADDDEETKDDDHASKKKPEPLHVLMDLGQKFQVRAKIPDPSLITVDIGLNFHVEMTLEEARVFVNRHLVHLTRYTGLAIRMYYILACADAVTGWTVECLQEARRVAAEGAPGLGPRQRRDRVHPEARGAPASIVAQGRVVRDPKKCAEINTH